jgi:hypothetical protein
MALGDNTLAAARGASTLHGSDHCRFSNSTIG